MGCLPVIGPSRNSNFMPSWCFFVFVANKTLMKKWILKALVQKTLSYLPGGHRVNYWFQKYVTRGVQLDDAHFRQKLEHAVDHVWFYEQHVGSLAGATCLELGSGWYPVVPLTLFLYGAEKVFSFDISSLMQPENIHTCLRQFAAHEADIRRELGPGNEERWSLVRRLAAETKPSSLTAYCRTLQLELRVQDARHTGLADASINLITSNNTFEHIYRDILRDMLLEFRRVVQPGGLMSHFIDLSDHFAHLDSSISIYHFLRFTEAEWKHIDNSIQPQNRLRWPHYLEIYRALNIPFTEAKVRPGDEALVRTLPLAPPFDQLPAREVAISHGYLLSRW